MSKSVINDYFHSLFTIKKKLSRRLQKPLIISNWTKSNFAGQRQYQYQDLFSGEGYVRSYILNEDNEEVTTNIYEAPCFVNDFCHFSDSSLQKKYTRQ